MDTTIYTDGSWDPTTKHGGWGLRVLRGSDVLLDHSGSATDTGINLMELSAFIEGLKVCEPHSAVTFATDSRNLIHWLDGSFQTRDPRVRTLVLEARALIAERHLQVTYQKVAAHTGVEHNEAVDRLARAAMNRAKGQAPSPAPEIAPLLSPAPAAAPASFDVRCTVRAAGGQASFVLEGTRSGAPYRAEQHLSGDAIDADLAALLHLARDVRPGEHVRMTTRSDNLVKWYSGAYAIKAPRVRTVFDQVLTLVNRETFIVTR